MSEAVWVVDDDHAIRWVLEKALHKASITFRSFTNGSSLLQQLLVSQPKLIISDIRMPGIDGLQLLDELRQQSSDIPVLIMTAHSDLDTAVASYQGGAFDYLSKPFDTDEVIMLVQRILQNNKGKVSERASACVSLPEKMIGEAPAMQELFRIIGRLSQSTITVMIRGASGTGKELVAQALHQHSPRASQPFVPLNMAAIPKDLIESELFGHEKGAFTGASNQRKGCFEQAHGGTLFLDEIGDMPAEAQTRLLRVLADSEFFRVGGHNSVRVDVRIIAATHQNLEQRVKEGLFREDLFHRLNVICIQLPNLSERKQDIPALTEHFLQRSANELGVKCKQLAHETNIHLQSLDWPGNVRQLDNLCRWISVMGISTVIFPSDLPIELQAPIKTDQNSDNDWVNELSIWAQEKMESGQHRVLEEAVPKFERALIMASLRQANGRRQIAAELLGWGRNTLTRKIKELQL
jgi:two-component system nitrogen regulation response regulator GlnG